MTAWYTADDQERLTGAWRDAPIEDEETLGFLLDTARTQVLAYAPAPADGADPEDPPFNYVYAQIQQARNLWNAGRVTPNADVGTEGYSYTPRPLDKTIRGIVRPADGRPDVY